MLQFVLLSMDCKGSMSFKCKNKEEQFKRLFLQFYNTEIYILYIYTF